MNRKRSILAIAALAALLLPAMASGADRDRIRNRPVPKELIAVPVPDPRLVPVPVSNRERPWRIDVWVRGGVDRVFFPGEPVVVCFRANQDAFVLVYDIDTEGRAHRLYPRTTQDPEFVEGGVTYAVPGRGAGYRLMVTGPPGVETIVATASDVPLSDRWDACWGGVAGRDDYDQIGGTRYRVGRVSGDRQGGVDRLQRKLIEVPGDDYYGPDTSVDQVSFRVGQQWRDGRDRGWADLPGHGGVVRRRSGSIPG
jgi:hypothetical protein